MNLKGQANADSLSSADVLSPLGKHKSASELMSVLFKFAL